MGVGINIEKTPDVPSSISLNDIGVSINLLDLADKFENILKHELINFDSNDFFINYRKAEILLGKNVRWNGSEGIVIDITENGELMVEENDNIVTLNAEEVHLEH